MAPSVSAQKTTLRDSAMAYFKAKRLNYTSLEWQTRVDSALKIDPTHDELWQQKAMPFLKNGDFGSWLKYIGKAVALNPSEYLPYRGFCRQIFMKDYEAALKDYEAAEKLKPKQKIHIVMDHTFDYYKSLCYMELQKPELALFYIQKSVDEQVKTKGLEWTHHGDLFYLGVMHVEFKNWQLALEYMDKCLKNNGQFPSALYYKALILKQLGRKEEAMPFLDEAEKYLKKGYSMNEDNEFYANYPKQVSIFDIEKLRIE